MIVCCVDLQQAFHKATSRTGMEAEAPAVDAEVLAQTDWEQELLDRIAQLEAQLKVQARHSVCILVIGKLPQGASLRVECSLLGQRCTRDCQKLRQGTTQNVCRAIMPKVYHMNVGRR